MKPLAIIQQRFKGKLIKLINSDTGLKETDNIKMIRAGYSRSVAIT